MNNAKKNMVRILAIFLAILFVAGTITLTLGLIFSWFSGVILPVAGLPLL